MDLLDYVSKRGSYRQDDNQAPKPKGITLEGSRCNKDDFNILTGS